MIINGIEREIKPHAYLFGANLSGADLSGADLSHAGLSGAHIFGANLSGADLSGADLYGANLFGANLFEANLFGAYLSGVNLFGANLFGANLFGASLSGANLSGAILPDGQTLPEYIKTLPEKLLLKGGKTLKEICDSWDYHSWIDCPMHTAFDANNLQDVPNCFRNAAALFVTLYDGKHIPRPEAA